MSQSDLGAPRLFLKKLGSRLHEVKDFGKCLACLKSGQSATLDGIQGSSCALVLAEVARSMDRPVLAVVPEQEQVDPILGDLELFSDGEAVGFPQLQGAGTRPKAIESGGISGQTIPDEIFGQRIRILKRLARGECPNHIVTSIPALIQPGLNRKRLLEQTLYLKRGANLDPGKLVRRLIAGGYHSTSGVELPGEFSNRGALLDIFAPDWDSPVRLEFFGDEIESIRSFEISSQRSLEQLAEIDLTDLNGSVPYDGFLSEFLPENAIIFLLEPTDLELSGRTFLERMDNLPHLHDSSEVFKRLLKFPCINASNIAQYPDPVRCTLPVLSLDRMHGDLAKVRTEIDNVATDEIYIVCPTEGEIKRLGETLAETKPALENRLHFATGQLSGGFQLTNANAILIGSGQLFGRNEIRRTRRRHLGQAIDSFLELKSGDTIVHLAHGIGRFRGMQLMEKGESTEEHLHLEFADETALYVPVSKISLVQKYVAGAKSKPRLSKLGSQLWNRSKQVVQEAIFDLASEMIDLQAARDSKPGITFPGDSDWQLEFDAAFPYRETDDQTDAIEAIKKDMQRSKPMDRLICGDVGFGKTEVAMRAVFKAVDAGFQAAVLVPTTILAEQHYRTFSERMAEFPFTIAALSRFQTKKEQQKIIEDLSIGKIDILIGTHRIVSKDVRFPNLGLVVIDEEQRFGVGHKERLKTLRQTVDVLTLSATPIPRTLHMSLLGIKDISNLETPPEDRLAVETNLARFDSELIRSALLREISRGGQAFFVHNRILDIEETAAKIREIVPEIRIGIGHAQMPEGELEKVMRSFLNREFDLLLCTTIIESGLDIPNANTIFIDLVDRYGLADLHQLRGRVGRYKNQAYCYLLMDDSKPMSNDTRKRLRAITEYSHLGAGFSLAMRDLEIRGAGNILGTQQSGHIAVIGYELYCQFLDSAVRALKSLPPKTVIEVEIDLPGTTLIPKGYIDDQRMKIDFYRRINRITDPGQVEDIRDEMIDRFGKPSRETERLFELARLRIDAHRRRIRKIRLEDAVEGDRSLGACGRYLVFEYVSEPLIQELKRKISHPLRTTEDRHAYLPIPIEVKSDPGSLLKFVREILG